MKKLISILVAFAMMMALAVTSAFAAPVKQTDGNAITNGTADDPANIAIEKVLKVAEGATIPGTTFKFDVAATAANAEKNPSAGTVTGYNTVVEATVDTTSGKGVTGFVFTGDEVFEKAGTYYFKVNEKVPTVAEIKAIAKYADSDVTVADGVVTIKTGDVTEVYTYDTTDHYIVAGVAKHIGEDGEPTYYINSIAVINDEGKEELKEVKVPVPGEPAGTTDEVDGYAFDVENNYQKLEENALKIEKEVKGKTVTDKATQEENDAATAKNQNFDTEKTFLFHVTLAKPSTSSATKYTGTVKKADGTTVETKEFAANGTTDVELAHGWYVEFSDIEYGVTYSVTEDDYSAIGYTVDEATLADEVTLKDNDEASKLDKVTNIYDSENDNTNTGITMNNLPFIVLALVAIGGLVAYVIVRRRNADEA